MSQEGAAPCTILPGLSAAFQKWTNTVYNKIREHKKSGQTEYLAYSKDGQVIVSPSFNLSVFYSPGTTGQVWASSCHHWAGVGLFLTALDRCVLLSGAGSQLITCLKMESPV